MGANVYAGLAVTSRRDGTLATATFSNVNVGPVSTPPPPPPPPPTTTLTSVDIGQVGAAGSTSVSNDVYTVRASGADIWGTQDEFRFVYLSLAGDGEVTARVDSVSPTDVWTKGGVMIRETLNANSRFADVLVSSGNGVGFNHRVTTGGSAGPWGVYDGVTRAPYWVRVQRIGNVFTGYVSADGQNWRQQGNSVTIAMGANVYAGLAVTSRRDGTLATATFSNVRIGPPDTSPPTNAPPVISGTPATTATVGVHYAFTPTATDADGNALTFSITNRPSWASFDTSTGQLSGTPASADVGDYANIVIGVSDGQATAQLPAFAIAVGDVSNRPPLISGTPATSATAGAAYVFQPTASDPDGNALTFSITSMPAWAMFDTATGQLSGTPASSHVGTYSNIVIGVSDGQAAAQLPAFSIVVSNAPNQPPMISGTPATSATAGTAYTFQPTASDPDGDALTFSIASMPSWATFSTATGRLSGTPASSHVGTYSNIVIGVSDGQVTTQLAAFSIVVDGAPNGPPVISGTPTTSATVGVAYAFQPTASDPDGNTLTFSITSRPSWATFNAATGRLSGTPASSHVGTYSNIVIGVSDGQATAQLPAFSIVVSNPPNSPPVISGTPPTSVTAGAAYAFQPTASDPDGNTLTFSIVNMPAWATFSESTGTLSGTPAQSHVGTHANIVITVSDGSATASLPAFSITVTAVSTGSATLSWNPPTTNTDGSPLTNLAGYRVYWGPSIGSYTSSVTLNNPGLASYVVENLGPGTYYFVVTARNSAGGESQYSNVASKTIQ
jgi:hypothetical protein